MATYNGEPFLEEQLESLFAQSILPDLIVISDDGSTDGTIELVNKISRNSPVRVLLVHNEAPAGYSKNFVNALSHAEADLFFYCDQDDVWLSQKIEAHLAVYAADPNAMLVISDQQIVGPSLEPTGRTSLGEITLRKGNDADFVHGCCTSFRSSLYDIALRPADGMAHDDWVHALAAACGARRIIKEPLQLFRRHGSNTTASAVNSFDVQRLAASQTSAQTVLTTLERKVEHARAVGAAFQHAHGLSDELRTRGQLRANIEAENFQKRAHALRSGVYGLPTLLANVCLRRQSFNSAAADVLRVLKTTRIRLRTGWR